MPLLKLKEDLDRYFDPTLERNLFQKIRLIIFVEGAWVLISYRLGQWVRNQVKIPIIKEILKAFTFLLHFMITVITKIEIPFDTQIGEGLYIGHSGYIVIHPSTTLGSYCNISPGVIIGEGGRGDKRGVPRIGNRVYIAPGAKIFGKIVIGNNVAIGANAVVLNDVPDNAVVAGVPAKIINYNGSKDFIRIVERD